MKMCSNIGKACIRERLLTSSSTGRATTLLMSMVRATMESERNFMTTVNDW